MLFHILTLKPIAYTGIFKQPVKLYLSKHILLHYIMRWKWTSFSEIIEKYIVLIIYTGFEKQTEQYQIKGEDNRFS